MVIENKQKIFVLRVTRLFLFLLVSTLVVIPYYFKSIEKLIVIDKLYFGIGLIVLFILYYCWGIVRSYGYFWFSDMGNKLSFRFYGQQPFVSKLKSFDVKKEDFYKFEIVSKWYGLRKYLIVYQAIKGQLAKYPPISLGSLSRTQIDFLEKSLTVYVKRKK